jgi:hypothetical protein
MNKAKSIKRKRTTPKAHLAKPKRERDAFMKKSIVDAIKWATKELAKVRKQGLLANEAADFILAEVGRRWNIGAMNAVEKKLDLHPTEPDNEPEDEEVEVFDEDGEVIES